MLPQPQSACGENRASFPDRSQLWGLSIGGTPLYKSVQHTPRISLYPQMETLMLYPKHDGLNQMYTTRVFLGGEFLQCDNNFLGIFWVNFLS